MGAEDEATTPAGRREPVPDSEVTEGVSPEFYQDTEPTREEMFERLLKRQDESHRYIIIEDVAEGGMGKVYMVKDQDLVRANVMKVMKPKLASNPQLFQSFVDEARITAQLEHPNIVPVHDLGVFGGDKLFFTMKLVEGEELALVLGSLRREEEEYVKKYTLYNMITMFRKVCDGVAYAHSKGIIHRDLKPDNIMVGHYGEVLVMDWGLARRIAQKDEPEIDVGDVDVDMTEGMDLSDVERTRVGVVKGTPAYMAPEQANGLTPEIDERTDVFLLGATLYALMTLYPPFRGKDVYEILDNAAAGTYTHPAERAPGRQIPEAICDIIVKAMAYESDRRYQSVEELAEDVDAYLRGDTQSEHLLFEQGALLMEEGDIGSEGYVILNGEVEVFKVIQGSEVSLVRLGPGDTVGEMAMISPAPRSASVRALENTETVIITGDTMSAELAKLPPWMGHVVQALVDRLRGANEVVHPLLRGDCEYHVMYMFRHFATFWGMPVNDETSNGLRLVIKAEDAVNEAATILSLPVDRVVHVLAILLDERLFMPYDEDHFYIQNFELFDSLLSYVRQRLGIETYFSEDYQTEAMAGDGEVLIRRTSPHQREEEVEIEATTQTNSADIVAYSNPDELEAQFDRLFQALQGPGTPIEIEVDEEDAEDE